MQHDLPPSALPHLAQRYQSLVWSCLDAELTKTAVFHAERYYSLDKHGHDSRHLYAIALLREGQTYSALSLVNQPSANICSGCSEIKAKCCTALGRHRQAREALEASMHDPNYVPSASTSRRVANPFPEEAALRCRSGTMALKGNLPEKASASFRQALNLNPQLWEAFEGLCSLGLIPDIDIILPPRPLPIKRAPPDETTGKVVHPIADPGFFTPDAGSSGNLFRTWKPDLQPQPFRMGPPPGPRDSIATNESIYPDHSFHQAHRATRSQPTNTTQPPIQRPLSSADEAGPNPKRQRSTARQPEAVKKTVLNHKLSVDDPLKKARARPALIFANISSSGRHSSQFTTSSRTPGLGKSNAQPLLPNTATRRSSRLHPPSKVRQARGRRRPSTTNARSKSAESEAEEDVFTAGSEVGYPPSPPSNAAQSPRSEVSPSPSNWTAAQEQAAQEEYDAELADYYVYSLTRKFACATRALALYDCQGCLRELEQLPAVHQSSPWVLAMVGRAHYEKQDFASAERAFKAVRILEPHRLWDMEVYSTLLWHLQRNVELSFLAQELLNINPRSSQAWIAVGNLFSLQKERSQALTCFRRAAEMDPTCAYAYTLSGHESIDEDLEKAINFFQCALRADRRHYNAWYGLGTCYLRMSRLRLAEYHYRKAVEIHPSNAVLLGCVGMTVERRGDRSAALGLFNDAVKLAPDNALVRYRRAKILVSMRKYELAVRDLEHLRGTTPEESNVVFQLAKVYRLLGNSAKSAHTLALARDISPKSLSKIKKLLETVEDAGDDEMDEG
ncbi:Protein bimA [Termitomyces sp. J132]|nr:Protein bimA [Termitomyces sp. J132]